MIVVPVLRRVERWRGEDEEGQGWVTVTTSTGLRGGKPPLESPPAAKRDGNGNTIGLWGSPFTGVAGAVWSLRSSLILREAFRSLSAERHERKVDGGGETRRRKILSSKPMEQGERGRDWETRVRKGRWKTREAEEALGGPTGAAWRTSRRPTSPLSPTPFSVTFLFLSVPSKRLKEAILCVLFFLFFFFFASPGFPLEVKFLPRTFCTFRIEYRVYIWEWKNGNTYIYISTYVEKERIENWREVSLDTL